MTADELVRRLHRLARPRGLPFRLELRHGRGSHGRPWLGDRRTVIAMHPGDIPKGTLHAMLRDLGLTLDDLR